MRARLIIGLVLAIMDLPILFIGMIDPLEGGIALLFGLIIGVVVWVVTRVPVPRFTWIAFVATMAVGAITLILAVTLPPVQIDEGVANPVVGYPPLAMLNWGWRIGVLVTLGGAIWYIARIVQAMRKPLAVT